MTALAELGLADRLRSEGQVTTEVEIRAGDGRVLRRLDVAGARLGGTQPAVVALRRTLYGALLDAAKSDDLQLASEATGFERSADGVTLRLRDGRTFQGALLVGADGIHSVIRRVLHPDEAPPRVSGYHGVRGVAYDVAQHLGGLSAVGYLGDGYEAAAAGAGMNAVYWYVSLDSEDLPAGTTDAAEVLRTWTPRFAKPLQSIVKATQPEDQRLDELLDRDPLDVWGSGPVTLLGDAAHPMMPHTGQGAAQALEDAVALGLALRDAGDVPASLRRYERVRAARTKPIVRLGRRIPKTTTTHRRAVHWLREAAIRTVPAGIFLRTMYLAGRKDPQRELR